MFIRSRGSDEAGYTMVAVVVISAFCLLLTSGMLSFASGSSSVRIVTTANTKNFYEVEKTINQVVAWLQTNAKNVVGAFTATNFSTNFDLGAPSIGANEGSSFQVPTLVKMKGTNNVVQLTNNSFWGTSAFPATTNIDTGAAFDAVSAFSSADFGNVAIRVLLVWARSTDGHYQPVFRIDAITGSNPERGVHGLNFIRTDLVTSNVGFGYFADTGDFTTNTPNNTCNSYVWSWNGAAWSRGASRTNCILLGTDNMTFAAKIWGSVYTNKTNGIGFTHSGAVSGTKCQASGCHTYSLPTQTAWATNCAASNQGDVTAANPTDLSSGASMAQRCWRDVTIGSNKKLNLVTPNVPYYFRTLDLHNNGSIVFPTVGPGNKYILYVEGIAGNKINGNQLVGTNLAPHQIEINVTGNINLTLNGTASIHGVFNCNHASKVSLSGNFSFYGAIRCNAIETIGNAVFNYDEALGGGPTLSDLQFTLYKASQRFR